MVGASFLLLDGPTFLVLYGFLFLILFVGALIVRRVFWDSPGVTGIALCAFQIVGLFRWAQASSAGMHKFGYLVLMMAIGGMLFCTRFESFGRGSSGGGSSGFFSCGGGGCGGGGGGGCGGCGG